MGLRRPDAVINVFREMKALNCTPSVRGYKAFTAACQETNRLPEMACLVTTKGPTRAPNANLTIFNAVIAACGGIDDRPGEALELFQVLPNPNPNPRVWVRVGV